MSGEIKGVAGTTAPNAGQDNQVRKPQATDPPPRIPTESADDKVILTDVAARIRDLQNASPSTAVVNEGRVEAVRDAVTNGTYDVNANRTAQKLLEFERFLTEAGRSDGT